jgi:hypothetical protein
VNYDSDGDCERPRDRRWTWMDLTNRVSRRRLSIETPADGPWSVQGDEPEAARAALFLWSRCGARLVGPALTPDAEWDHAAAAARAAEVAGEFERPELDLFDSAVWWGSWKWIGWFATDFTWVGRWIMHALPRKDARAVTCASSGCATGTSRNTAWRCVRRSRCSPASATKRPKTGCAGTTAATRHPGNGSGTRRRI